VLYTLSELVLLYAGFRAVADLRTLSPRLGVSGF